MKIAIGSDHAGLELKEYVKKILIVEHEVIDTGTTSEDSCDYPDFAQSVCTKILNGEVQRGILICGTGIGMSIAANRFPRIRAALCHDVFTASRARLHNDAVVLVMGAQVVEKKLASEMVKVFLETDFDYDNEDNSRHIRRLKSIENYK